VQNTFGFFEIYVVSAWTRGDRVGRDKPVRIFYGQVWGSIFGDIVQKSLRTDPYLDKILVGSTNDYKSSFNLSYIGNDTNKC